MTKKEIEAILARAEPRWNGYAMVEPEIPRLARHCLELREALEFYAKSRSYQDSMRISIDRGEIARKVLGKE